MPKHGTLLVFLLFLLSQPGYGQENWIDLFDGSSLEGWKASENPESFNVVNGSIVCDGPRAHLFYTGTDGEADFTNFEFKAQVKTSPGANSGIYFHTRYQDAGWPQAGHEAQIFNGPVPGRTDSSEAKLTGSLYAVRNVWKAPVRDNEWFDYRIRVEGRTIRIHINNTLLVDYTEPLNPPRAGGQEGRVLSSGTFALQCHDPHSKVYFRDLMVRRLADDLPSPGRPPADPDLDRRLTELGWNNFPLVDYHAHLKGKLTIETLLAQAREYGFTYGIPYNCGIGHPLTDEHAVRNFLTQNEKIPGTYLAMQAEGREWMDLFTRKTIERFDYVITDSMTIYDFNGKRMRLWIEEETEVGDPEEFMEMLVARIEKILNHELLDIYVNPTFLPAEIQGRYDELWTDTRMDRVIKALARNKVAMEINSVRRIPSLEFIRKAKQQGVKFTLGTNNSGEEDLFKPSYWLEAIAECGLTPEDMWSPDLDRMERK